MSARLSVVSLLLVLLAACAHRPDEGCVVPAAGVRYCLLAPGAMAGDGNPRLVHVAGPEVDRYLVSQANATNDALVLAASTLLGQPLFEIHYTRDSDGRARIEMRPDDAPARAGWLLAMLQLAYAEPAALNGALSGARLQADGDARRVVRNEQVLVNIERHDGMLRIVLPGQSLRIDIRPLAGETVTK